MDAVPQKTPATVETLPELLARVGEIIPKLVGAGVSAAQVCRWRAMVDAAIAEQQSLQCRFDNEVGRCLNLVTDLREAKAEICRIRALAAEIVLGPKDVKDMVREAVDKQFAPEVGPIGATTADVDTDPVNPSSDRILRNRGDVS